MPREPYLTEEMIEKAAKLIKAGNYTTVVIQYLGVAENTYYGWIKKARQSLEEGDEDNIYVKFLRIIKESEAEAEFLNVQRIQKAAQEGTWTASAWWLERKCGDRWTMKNRIEHSGNIGSFDVSKLSDQQLQAIASGASIGGNGVEKEEETKE